MKNARRIFAVALAVMMILAMATTVFAAGDYTITITNSATNSSSGHVYEAYQIFGGKLDSSGKKLSDIVWGESMGNAANIANFVEALKGDATFGTGAANLFSSASTAQAVADVLATPANQTAAILSAFAKHATDFVVGAPIGTSTQADAPYTITIPEAKPGYYLVKDVESELDGDKNKDVSDYILQVVGDVTVEHKGSIPTMEKKVSETGATYHDYIASGIGEPHYYRITAELPDDYDLYDTYYLKFNDQMSSELTYDELVTVKAIIRSGGVEKTIDSSCYSVTPIVATAGANLQVILSNTKAITSGGAAVTLTEADAIEIVYKAHVNDTAIVDGTGIENTASIIYSNNPNSTGHGESTSDQTHVYPVNLQLVKKDGVADTALAGAKFVLVRQHNDGVGIHDEYVVVDANNKVKEWAHHYEGDGHDPAEHVGETMGSVLITPADGTINVIGLDAGTYSLLEIEAPDGYNKLTAPVSVSINIGVDETNNEIKEMSGTVSQGTVKYTIDTATATVTIPNYQGNVLPSTGGIGTTLFYVIGGLLAAGAVVLLVTKKRMSAEN